MKASITLEGSPNELYLALQKLIDFEQAAEVINAPIAEPPDTYTWTEEGAKEVYKGISLGAWKVFREIASRREPYSIDTMMRKFELSGNALGGTMSSPTRQMRIKGYARFPYPVKSNYVQGIGLAYVMDPVWKKVVTEDIERTQMTGTTSRAINVQQ